MRRLRQPRLPNQLKVLRAQFNVTQAEIAHRMGLDTADYNRIERGKLLPTPAQRDKLAALFGTTADVIFTSDAIARVA